MKALLLLNPQLTASTGLKCHHGHVALPSQGSGEVTRSWLRGAYPRGRHCLNKLTEVSRDCDIRESILLKLERKKVLQTEAQYLNI